MAADGLTPAQETFAQMVASGRNQADSYRVAYPKSQQWEKNGLYVEASNLASKPKVSLRIRTLRAEIAQEAMEEAVVDKCYVLKRLKTVADRCLQSAPVVDKKGEHVLTETPDGEAVAYEFNASGANRALELLGKEIGMFIDRSEIGVPGQFEEVSDDQIAKELAAERAALKAIEGAEKSSKKSKA